MKKGKVLKIIFLILMTVLILFGFYNVLSYFLKGNLKISVNASNTYYSGENIDVLVNLKNIKTDKSVDGKVKLELYDSNNKKVKKAKVTKKVKANDNECISLNLADDLETENYYLKITARSGLYKESLKENIAIKKNSENKTVISLDKGIYKPGDEINYRALVVSSKNYSPQKEKVSVYIYDGNENKVYSEETETSDYGIISGKFKLGDEVNSGTYKIVIDNSNQMFSKEFTVNPYITPKFEANVTTDKDYYIVGETAQVTINAKYFFGESVSNANIKGKIKDTDVVGITNDEGNFVTSYEVKESGKIALNFEITDTSNYAVEANKSITAGTDRFEIEVLPEFGDIVRKVDNNIYVITKTADGKPVKTYINITIGKVKKQVITDENGIGCFELTSSETEEYKTNSSNYYSYNSTSTGIITLECKDMNGNIVSKAEEVKFIPSDGSLIKTDKVKYNVGDDINVSLVDKKDVTNPILYVYKNNELLKIVSSENEDMSFNLGDISGVIDIYTQKTKRTIFIKPNKSLNINIETNSEEYKPGENLNIKFSTTDESNNSVDSALLVSILDNEILNLAENDLSIDNIKMALQDIELTGEMTAADLYANIIDDSSDVNLNAILLKQSYKSPNLISDYSVEDDSESYLINALLAFGIIIILFTLYACITKQEKFLNIVKGIVNIFGISVILFLSFERLLIYDLDFSELMSFLMCFVITLVTYILILRKYCKEIFRSILGIILCLLIFIAIDVFELERESLFSIFVIIFLIFIATNYLLKDEDGSVFLKALNNVSRLVLRGTWLICILVGSYLNFDWFGIIIALIVDILVNKIIFRKNKNKTKSVIQDGKIVLNITGGDILAIIVVILLILFVFGLPQTIKTFGGTINEDSSYNSYNNRHTSTSESITNPDPIIDAMTTDIEAFKSASVNDSSLSAKDISIVGTFGDATDSTSTSKTMSGVSDVTSAIASIFDSSSSKEDKIENSIKNSADIKKEEQTEENVRNVFLESLAFIPELVTENGNASLDLKISDNITTWNIQTVGNTKDGSIGYNSKSFKVFKEFFVDYTLPTNCVVTDKVSIPVTLYNYTENSLDIDVNVVKNDWCNIGNYTKTVNVPSQSTSMIYVPLEIIKQGDNTLRIETKSSGVSDIVEKTMTVKLNGLEKQDVVSSGTIEKSYKQDIIFDENVLDNNKKIKLKLYTTPITQAIQNIEGILKLPTGCFEQTSSSLYPDILVLKYLKNNNLNNETLEEKAKSYISTGYQKLLTYEVSGEKGGYSLYGNAPAEPVITAFGLMEFNELKDVYEIDENVIKNMKEYLFKKQKLDGSFDYTSTYIGSASSTDKYAMNSYIIWALSEVCPDDSRLNKSINYLENNLDKITDNYTLALIANIYANTNNENKAKNIIKEITNNFENSNNRVYVKSSINDYYGTYGKYQNVQATALTSIALSKLGTDSKTNSLLVDYLVTSKISNGTWGTTQSTILALRAINEYTTSSDISDQTVTIKFNDEERNVEIKKDSLDYYEFEFDNVSNENKISIDMSKGKFTYEIIKDYYVNYSEAKNNENIKVTQALNTSLKVNDIITQQINIANSYGNISNGLIEISIPQGTTPVEESLLKLKYDGKIEKYEYNYGKINIYVRNFQKSSDINLEVQYKALYPVNITGGCVRFYDYYNPDIESLALPVNITVEN